MKSQNSKGPQKGRSNTGKREQGRRPRLAPDGNTGAGGPSKKYGATGGRAGTSRDTGGEKPRRKDKAHGTGDGKPGNSEFARPWKKDSATGGRGGAPRDTGKGNPWKKEGESGGRKYTSRDHEGQRTGKDKSTNTERRTGSGDFRKPSKGPGAGSGPDRDFKRAPRKSFGEEKQQDAGRDAASPYRERGKRKEGDNALQKKGEKKPYTRKGSDDRSDIERKFRSGKYEKPSEGERKPYRSRDIDKTAPRSFGKPKSDSNRPFRRDDKELIRLNRYIANAGICSRREADTLIEAGAISVNGVIVTQLGIKVGPDDKVQYGDQTLSREKLRYVLLNKPKGFITTMDDPDERKTVMSLVESACRERIYPVGRLDRNTTGVLLFTNDGPLAKKLMHPKHNIRKIYHVVLNKNLQKSDMNKIVEGIELEDGPAQADSIAYVGNGDDKSQVGIELHSGKNRVVRRIFEALGYEVVKLDRVLFAGLTKKDLARGRWRHLKDEEVNLLKRL